MKRTIFLVVAVIATLHGAAINRLYIEDFTIAAGETMQAVLFMDNDQSFTAFQTDLILPEGLSVVQEDDEYLFDLSGRKANDHTIISKMREDGAIRMVSFSIGVKPYRGNSGALVIIRLAAEEDFTGPATIELKHSICTTVDGQEFGLEGDSCNVLLLERQIMGDVNGDGSVDIADVTDLISYLLNGCTKSFHYENAHMNDDGTLDVADVTSLISHILGTN